MSQEMIRRGYRPATMPLAMAEAMLATVAADTFGRSTFGPKSEQPIAEFIETLAEAVAEGRDPTEFWFTELQQVYVNSILGHAWAWHKYPEGVSRETLKEAQVILRAAWAWAERPVDRGEIDRGTASAVSVPVPTPERLADCGFRDVDHLERYFCRDRIPVYTFESREQMQTYYMHGWCSVLAMAIHRRTGWPLVGVFDPWETGYPFHVACRAPDGTYVDARGAGMTLEELAEPYQRWPDSPMEVREMAPMQVLSRFPLHPHYHDLAESDHLDILLPDLGLEAAPSP